MMQLPLNFFLLSSKSGDSLDAAEHLFSYSSGPRVRFQLFTREVSHQPRHRTACNNSSEGYLSSTRTHMILVVLNIEIKC